MRWQVINKLIEKYKLDSYLEIGVQHRVNWNQIKCKTKFCVDPEFPANFTGTSDDFFRLNADKRFDIVFIDGLHHADQVEKDIVNAINVAGVKVVVLHDCLPTSFEKQIVPRQTKEWFGDVWRAFVGFRAKYPEWNTYCHAFDCGIGVILVEDKIEAGFISDMPYVEFEKNKNQLLNLI